MADLPKDDATDAARNPFGLEYTEDFTGLFWAYNLPLQLFRESSDGSADAVNYMARKEACCDIEIPAAQVPAVCRNAARLLRNLADLFDAAADGRVTSIYYPDETLADAMQKS